MQKITPCLWFDDQAEEAANFYVSVFSSHGDKESKIIDVVKYPEAAEEVSGKKAGTVMTVTFRLQGQDFMALNGGPIFKFSEAVSLIVDCKTQEEADDFWEKFTEGGEESQCGWLKDRYGFSWQITPSRLSELLGDKDPVKADRAMKAMLGMKRIDIAEIERAMNVIE